MQGYKINVNDYYFDTVLEVLENGQYVFDPETGDPKLEKKSIKVYPRLTLPLMLCNSQVGGVGGQAPADFDLYEIGTIAKLIESSDGYVILDQAQYDKLVSRVKQLQKHLNYKYFELVSKIMNAEKVELTEKGNKLQTHSVLLKVLTGIWE